MLPVPLCLSTLNFFQYSKNLKIKGKESGQPCFIPDFSGICTFSPFNFATVKTLIMFRFISNIPSISKLLL